MKGKRVPPPLGNLRVKILRGFNLAKRDLFGSDPYVILSMPPQRVKTKVVKRNLNPVWNEELSLSVYDPSVIMKLEVFDKDIFSRDDPMGNADIHIQPLVEIGMSQVETTIHGVILRVVIPDSVNCLAGDSIIRICHGKVVQNMVVRLRDVECGEVMLRLEWINYTSVDEHCCC